MWAEAIVGLLFAVWYVFLRPRRGGKDAPPLASDFGGGPFPYPIVGHLKEFFSSPNSMIERCTKEIGPVFTIPVRCLRDVHGGDDDDHPLRILTPQCAACNAPHLFLFHLMLPTLPY
jgi:hypothetical protein